MIRKRLSLRWRKALFKAPKAIRKLLVKNSRNIFLSVLTGLLAVAAFPKISLFFLAWIALVPLLLVLSRSSVKQSFFYAFLSGFVFNAAGLYWLIPMLHFNTGSYVQAFSASCVLWAYLALYWGVWGWLFAVAKKYFSSTWIFSVFMPAAWVVLEYARTYFLTGFPWMLAGYSQYRFTEIIQIAEFTGVYGVSFVLVFCNILFYFWMTDKKGNKYLYSALFLITALSVFGAFRLDKFKFFGNEEFTVAIVQPNIDQYKKWDQGFKDEILYSLEYYADKISDDKVDLVVWPEAAMPDFVPYDKQALLTAEKIAKTAGGLNIIGAPHNDKSGKLFNAVFEFDGSGYKSVHKKNHLVPFGEYVPLRKQLGRFFGVLNDMGDFEKGTDKKVFTDGKVFAGPTICSENFYPDISRQFCLDGAKVLTNHTNDAWFFDTAAPYQHFMMNVFRAVENRKFVLVSANSGVSGIVEASGRIVSFIPASQEALITAEFLQNDFHTFYTLRGDIFVKICMFVLIFLFVTILIL
ncbi:MAG: apolipoprotein N-acyltransferase [Endomicrobia bacterium]|nr:apolipoprotein N-acyltransferase [Endomicrobiia bacterium]MCL2799111.1 apolipoprotein N-acyltransferase [Endomicrobiia bacterium]